MKTLNEKPTILVVDDTPENITLLRDTLCADHHIRPAINGRLALKLAKKDPKPDLILLDIMMPDMDGYEVCRRLKLDPETRDIPVIFVTVKSEVDDELKGLALGGVDYIPKPFSLAVVLARVHIHLTLKQMRQELEEKNLALSNEREMIETIVLNMRSDSQFDDRGLCYLISSVEETNGDILLSVYDTTGRQLVLLGDFTGHGLPAAIGGPLVSYIFYKMAARGSTILEIFSEINRVIYRQLPTGVFMVATILEISAKRDQVFVLNAALSEGVLVRSGSVIERFSSQTFPLGIVDDLPLNTMPPPLAVQPGDRLYAFSDGIIEAKSFKDEEMFGTDRLELLLQKIQSEDLALEKILQELDLYCATQSHEDDITLVEVHF